MMTCYDDVDGALLPNSCMTLDLGSEHCCADAGWRGLHNALAFGAAESAWHGCIPMPSGHGRQRQIRPFQLGNLQEACDQLLRLGLLHPVWLSMSLRYSVACLCWLPLGPDCVARQTVLKMQLVATTSSLYLAPALTPARGLG